MKKAPPDFSSEAFLFLLSNPEKTEINSEKKELKNLFSL